MDHEPKIVEARIDLTEEERSIFAIIRDHASSLTPPVVPRLAGGWVRDKLMGIRSYDIDVVLDTVSGSVFAAGLSAAHGPSSGAEPRVSSIGTIRANPEQSKHLETTVVRICGVPVDFVQFRKECYSTSRIPTVEVGTAMDDAMRRDLTINSLFYNLVTGKVEDFLGTGFDDIHEGILRTPYEDPSVTFLEDPLRIVRVFRFRSKLGFGICDRIYKAISAPRIIGAFETKVSRERVEMEVFKILSYPTSYLGMIEIINTGYFVPIFKPRVVPSVDLGRSRCFYLNCLRGICCIDSLSGFTFVDDLDGAELISEIQKYENIELQKAGGYSTTIWKRVRRDVLVLYMGLSNTAAARVNTHKKSEYVNTLVMSEGLKSSNERTRMVTEIERGISYLTALKQACYADMVATLRGNAFECLLCCAAGEKDVRYLEWARELVFSELYDRYKAEPIITGNDIKHLPIQPREIKNVLHKCFVYQIAHPGADKAEIMSRVVIGNI